MTTEQRRGVGFLTERDHVLVAYVAKNPMSGRKTIADALDRPRGTVAHRLQALVASGYLIRHGDDHEARYTVGRVLPALTSFTLRTCPVCRGRWRPMRNTPSSACPACRRVLDAQDRARQLGVGPIEIVVRPLESRGRATHPLHPNELVWVDGPGDVDAIAGDARHAREARAAA
ncbi:hypothetical protein [Patulibacter sp. SYSU D01012]|uniref:hypothetical protein n=1 Tax=Patulibacter sp. SYSU D01012 TaxID=2817381 RepID=UPI001B300214|nr:hypothetical protein [Patulibacter sp. SYSU D01012]